jgi:hypothetical protein
VLTHDCKGDTILMKKTTSVKKYKVQVIGCDDSTDVDIELDIHEFRLVDRIARLISDKSTYPCEPKMTVYPIEE